MIDPALARYLRGLAGSWRAFAAGHDGADVVEGPGFLASRHPFVVLNNAVLLDDAALPRAMALFDDGVPCSVWSGADDATGARTLAAAGFRRDVTTRAMIRNLVSPAAEPRRRAPHGTADVPVVADASAAVLARLNGTPDALLDGVPGARCWATADGAAGLLVQDVGDDVVVSFVATRSDSRRRGLATRVLRVALDDARRRGARAAVLQATAEGEQLYVRTGFEPVATWQEWSRPTD